jgi:hypothetical protein
MTKDAGSASWKVADIPLLYTSAAGLVVVMHSRMVVPFHWAGHLAALLRTKKYKFF